MKKNFIHKFVALFVLLVSYYLYSNINEEENKYIKNQFIRTALKSADILQDYHTHIFEKVPMDPQKYLAVVRDLSELVDDSRFYSLKSYIRKNDKFVLTGTSATASEFRSESYERYGDANESDSLILSKIYLIDDSEDIQVGDKLAVGFSVGRNRYYIVGTIDRDKVVKHYSDFSTIYGIAMAMSILIVIILLFMLSVNHRQITLIDLSLKSFFAYLEKLHGKDAIVPAETLPRNAHGLVSRNINVAVERIVSMVEQNRADIKRDKQAIVLLTEAMEPAIDGSFGQNLGAIAHNPQLNHLISICNELLAGMHRSWGELSRGTKAYLQGDFMIRLNEENKRGDVLEVTKNLNLLAKEHSKNLLDRANYLIAVSRDARRFRTHIESNSDLLNDILLSIKKVSLDLESDYKFAFEFDSSIKVIKQENSYVNRLLDDFGKKYEESISLIDDYRRGIFRNDSDAFIRRINEIVKDSSVRDEETQRILIQKVRDVTFHQDGETSAEKIRELLKLLLEELVKDIHYSLYLIEEKVERLLVSSSARVSSFASIGEISNSLKDSITQEMSNANRIEKMVTDIINKTNDKKYEIVDHYHFVDKEEIDKILEEKE